MQSSKLIASLVVFRELYDSDKDIYDIISEFIKAAAIQHKKWRFGSTEMTTLLSEEFDFKLPEAVIKNALKNRLVKSGFVIRDNGEYTVTSIGTQQQPVVQATYQNRRETYRKIEQEFIRYIGSRKATPLETKELTDISDNLIQYLLGATSNEKYTQQISSYIIQNEDNEPFQERLNMVKEGLILYTGIRYTADLNQLGHWSNNLTIFLDTDMLFNFLGYSGQIYRDFFMDFRKLVREINQNAMSKKGSKKIKLRYFEESEKEIIGYFRVAELIIEGKKKLDPSKTAMKEILNGCSTKSDIVIKKSNLFRDLKASHILKEEPKDYYQDHSYNVEGVNILESIKATSKENGREFNEEKCVEYLKRFTKINVLRKGVSGLGFEKCGHIILTGNRLAHFLAHNQHIKQNDKDIPFATDIDFITDKFWFKLKKGFGNNNDRPKSFDYITKAQIVLSAQLNNKVEKKFSEYNELHKTGQISNEEAISLNYELRENSLKPEEISSRTLEQSLYFINESNIDAHARELQSLKQKAKEGKAAIDLLNQRERLDRNSKTKNIKFLSRLYSISLQLLALLLILSIPFVVYHFAKYFREPGDSELAIFSVVIGLISFIPAYRFYKKIKIRIKSDRIKSFKAKLKFIIKD